MAFRRFRRRSILPRRRPKWRWIRQTFNNAAPSGTLNSIDLLSNFKTHAGISINLPDITIWRLRIRISIDVSITGGTTTSNDGVLVTAFVDSSNQVVVSQLLDPMDQHDMVYDMLYTFETIARTDNNLTTNFVALFREYDLKSRRVLQNIDDTLFIQLAASGNAVIANYSISMALLTKMK